MPSSRRRCALEAPARAALEPGARAVEPLEQLRQVGDDEPAGDARSRGADVGGEVAERRVLLVADRAHDRHRAIGDRAHQPLVAEGQQVLEAAAASRHDDDVDAFAAERAQRLDDGAGGARPLDVGLGHEHVRRREAGGDGGQDVALGGGVVARSRARCARAGAAAAACARRRTGLRPRASPSAARARPGARRGRSAPARARAAGTRRAPRTAPVGHTRGRASPSASSSRSASNWPRAIETPRHEPSCGSLSVKKTLAQRSERRSSVTSPSTQTVGSRASQEATPRLKAPTE